MQKVIFKDGDSVSNLRTTDRISKEKRSKIMRSIKSSGTKPELYFEKEILTIDGYTKQCKTAFNSDFAYESQMIAIFVDGTFWHGKHFDYETSKLNDHWKNHIQGNIDRDIKNRKYLSGSGWVVLNYWEDELEENKCRISRDIVELVNERTKNPPKHSQVQLSLT